MPGWGRGLCPGVSLLWIKLLQLVWGYASPRSDRRSLVVRSPVGYLYPSPAIMVLPLTIRVRVGPPASPLGLDHQTLAASQTPHQLCLQLHDVARVSSTYGLLL